jgi:hypothetical protein
MADILKIDLKRKFRHLYNPTPKNVTIVDVPAFNYLMINGAGDPNISPEYVAAVNALYSVAYTLKFMIKKSDKPIDYTVMALEGLWWSDDMTSFTALRKDNWKWTMMIMQPEFVTQEWVNDAIAEAMPALPKLRYAKYEEGLCAQIMHLGPYADEGPKITKVNTFISENGYRTNGKHHEIYLNDPRKTAPARMKTIIRQPIA